VLTNTYFNQDDETFFTITAEELEQCPDIKPIQFSEASYNLGDIVSITLEGIPNPKGTNQINGFLVNIFYGKDGYDYFPGYHQEYVYASGNTATISITPAKGDNYLTIEAWAFDAPESTGGLMSEKETASTWIKDEVYAPVVYPLPLIVAIAVFIIMLIVALLVPMPYGMYGRMMVVVLGAVLAALIYWYMGGAF